MEGVGPRILRSIRGRSWSYPLASNVRVLLSIVVEDDIDEEFRGGEGVCMDICETLSELVFLSHAQLEDVVDIIDGHVCGGRRGDYE